SRYDNALERAVSPFDVTAAKWRQSAAGCRKRSPTVVCADGRVRRGRSSVPRDGLAAMCGQRSRLDLAADGSMAVRGPCVTVSPGAPVACSTRRRVRCGRAGRSAPARALSQQPQPGLVLGLTLFEAAERCPGSHPLYCSGLTAPRSVRNAWPEAIAP